MTGIPVSTGHRLRLADMVWLLSGIAVAYALLASPSTIGDGPGLRRFLTPEINRHYRVAQRFRMDAALLSGIEIRAFAVGPAAGRYQLSLTDTATGRVERGRIVAAEDLVADESFAFRFEPIELSAGREYEFDVMPTQDGGSGVALWATKAPRVRDGVLKFNDVARWGTLVFQTRTSSVAPLKALIGGSTRPLRWTAVIWLVGYWIVLRFLLHSFALGEQAPSANGRRYVA